MGPPCQLFIQHLLLYFKWVGARGRGQGWGGEGVKYVNPIGHYNYKVYA